MFATKLLSMEKCSNDANFHCNLHEAIRYAVFNGGKRLRPALMYATGIALGGQQGNDVNENNSLEMLKFLNAAAASIEFIHSYSLVHDDLPAMDDDDFRRGKPACHKAFNEAVAILVGDALQALAFELLSNAKLNPCSAETRIEMVKVLAQAAGMQGMVLGQAQDLAAENQAISLEQLTQLHQNKTGAMIKAAIHLAILACRGTAQDDYNIQDSYKIQHNNNEKPAYNDTELNKTQALLLYGEKIGLAFQVYDDILDITSDTISLGKPANSDLRNNKSTFPALMGLEAARDYAEQLQQDAINALVGFDSKADYLRDLAKYFVQRTK